MAVAAPTRRYTIPDLADFPDDGKLRELVDGQIVEWDVTNLHHGYFITALSRLLANFVFDHNLGLVVSADPYVRVQGSDHDVRGPDIAFYAIGRIPHNLRASAADIAPDFVIEILSPSDRAAAVARKIADWLRAGVRLLWYVDPETGTTSVYHGRTMTFVQADETLDAADVVPGFTVRLQDIIDRAASLTADE